MPTRSFLAAALFTVLAGGAAQAANYCKADHLSCVTTMPIGGYCECTSRGVTEGGEVVSRLPPRTPVNGTAGGCGSDPRSPGCR